MATHQQIGEVTRPAAATPSPLDPTRVLEAVADVQDAFIAGRAPGEVFEDLLSHVLAITDSEYGYIGEVIDEDGTPFLKAYAMTDISWDDASREIYRQARLNGGFEFRNLKTLFGAVLTTGEPVIANDAPNDPWAGGTMRGHLPLDRFLGLPLFSEGELVGSVGVSNRPGGYDEAMVAALRPFLSTCGNLVRAFRNRRSLQAAEQRVRSRELELRTVVESAGDGIVAFDPDGWLRSVNPAARQLLGTERVASLWELAAPGEERRLHRLVSVADGVPVEVELQRSDGSLVPVDLSVSCADTPEGRVCVGVLRDARARKEAEQALVEAKEAAERTLRAKDEFLAAMSHELRNPLNGVIGLSAVLATGTPGPLTDRQSEYVAMIHGSGEHLLRLIDGILELARLEAGQVELRPRPVDVVDLVRRAVDTGRAEVDQPDRPVTIDLPDERLAVSGDAGRLTRALGNLVANACRFTPDDGPVGVRVWRAGTQVAINVWDHGIGIAPEDQDRLFTPFEQLDARLSRQYGGAGLGLALTQRLVALHHGTVSVDSAPGRGSVFTVRLSHEPQPV